MPSEGLRTQDGNGCKDSAPLNKHTVYRAYKISLPVTQELESHCRKQVVPTRGLQIH